MLSSLILYLKVKIFLCLTSRLYFFLIFSFKLISSFFNSILIDFSPNFFINLSVSSTRIIFPSLMIATLELNSSASSI